MGRYANKTSVPVSRSRDELERTLMRYGADNFGYFNQGDAIKIAFCHQGLNVLFTVPNGEDDQQTRQRWRALNLVVKAKLEAIDSGISTFEDEFLSNVVYRGGVTIGEHIRPQLPSVADGGELRLLPAPPKDGHMLDAEVC